MVAGAPGAGGSERAVRSSCGGVLKRLGMPDARCGGEFRKHAKKSGGRCMEPSIASRKNTVACMEIPAGAVNHKDDDCGGAFKSGRFVCDQKRRDYLGAGR